MDSSYYLIFAIFTILALVIVIDANVGDYIMLQLKFLPLRIEKMWWMFKYHPNNFITTWIQNRKYDRIARELHAEMERQRTELNDNSKTVE